MKLRAKNNQEAQGPKTPFTALAGHIALHLTQALKRNEDCLGDSLEEAIEKTANCTVALDNGEPVFITASEAVNYSIPLESKEFFALVAKASRAAGIKGLLKPDIKKIVDSVALSASLDGQEVDVGLYSEYLDEDDPASGVVLNTNRTDGKAIVLANGEVKTISEQTGITFRYTPKNGSLIYAPSSNDSAMVVTSLKKLFSNLDEEQFGLAMAYAGYTLSHPRTDGLTFPILYLHGNAGTGKTTVARLITKLLGLGEDTVKAQPKDGRDLVATVAQNYMICFDNCGGINDRLANTLCSVATGGTVDDRKLYTNTDVVATRLHQPMVMTAISFPKQHDLCTRALFVKAGKPKITYGSDTEIFRKLDAILPQAQAWLLETTAKAMTYMGNVHPIAKHRAGDFNTWLATFEKALGINDQSIQHYMNKAQEDALNQQVVEHDELLASIVNVVQQHKCFTGGPSEVHKMLMNSILAGMRRLPRNWPQNASALTNRLNRIKEQLEKHGIEMVSGGARGTHGRKLTLRLIEAVPVLDSIPAPIAEMVPNTTSMIEEIPVGLWEELELPDSEEGEFVGLDPLDEEEMDKLMQESEDFDANPDWRQMTQAESDAALSDFLG